MKGKLKKVPVNIKTSISEQTLQEEEKDRNSVYFGLYLPCEIILQEKKDRNLNSSLKIQLSFFIISVFMTLLLSASHIADISIGTLPITDIPLSICTTIACGLTALVYGISFFKKILVSHIFRKLLFICIILNFFILILWLVKVKFNILDNVEFFYVYTPIYFISVLININSHNNPFF